MMKSIVIISFIVLLILDAFLRRKQKNEKNKIEDELVGALLKKDYKKFDQLIDSEDAQRRIAPFNRHYMKLNAAILRNKNIDAVLESFEKIKMNQAQKNELYSKAFGYYVEKENKEKSSYYKDKILNDTKSESLHEMANRMYSIYIDKSDMYLDILLKENESLTGAKRASNDALLAKIYENKKDNVNQEKYLNQFKEDMKGK